MACRKAGIPEAHTALVTIDTSPAAALKETSKTSVILPVFHL
jgi:hypothetical protein